MQRNSADVRGDAWVSAEALSLEGAVMVHYEPLGEELLLGKPARFAV